MQRCGWVNLENELYVEYHDQEWGVPVYDDHVLFEFLILEGAQAGLSWETILKRRKTYKEAFDDFDFEKIAKYTEKKEQQLLQNEGIIRNKLKVKAAIKNAQVFIKIREEFGSFKKYLWGFIDDTPINNTFQKLSELPVETEISKQISKDLKKRGMSFVGPTIIYAYMQAIGMMNDHTVDCFRYNEV